MSRGVCDVRAECGVCACGDGLAQHWQRAAPLTGAFYVGGGSHAALHRSFFGSHAALLGTDGAQRQSLNNTTTHIYSGRTAPPGLAAARAAAGPSQPLQPLQPPPHPLQLASSARHKLNVNPTPFSKFFFSIRPRASAPVRTAHYAPALLPPAQRQASRGPQQRWQKGRTGSGASAVKRWGVAAMLNPRPFASVRGAGGSGCCLGEGAHCSTHDSRGLSLAHSKPRVATETTSSIHYIIFAHFHICV